MTEPQVPTPGADPDLAIESGLVPLWVAAYHGYVGAVELLLQHGAVPYRMPLNGLVSLVSTSVDSVYIGR